HSDARLTSLRSPWRKATDVPAKAIVSKILILESELSGSEGHERDHPLSPSHLEASNASKQLVSALADETAQADATFFSLIAETITKPDYRPIVLKLGYTDPRTVVEECFNELKEHVIPDYMLNPDKRQGSIKKCTYCWV
ncbi:hypothetical protein Tco_1342767, partial [Tanacetum coccineum]